MHFSYLLFVFDDMLDRLCTLFEGGYEIKDNWYDESDDYMLD